MNGIGLINATGEPAVADSFHTLVGQPTSFCNLDCTYCYLPDRRSLRRPGSSRRIGAVFG
ncbi:hypothetical protein GA0070620_0439 [Micromonospora krabiensis]|uniref:Uncharacterized protein n=1 Tax=Micromonospora krabiensis TaxID=307121 RepID=A0A1C3MXB8_9ACTN|nr:hypothetical protein [Micromonospora krabiensis]SBV24973.1 hypothetical protein GA0070620_0439 [Micromonospora krabiensis]